jgi:soluble lytic murein transglycosylase-like protein
MQFFGMKPAWMGLFLLSFLHMPAQADVWGFIDEKGTAHFAAEAMDARYELFYRGNDAFDTRDGMAPQGAQGTARPVVVPTAQPKLVAYFEVAPAFRSVKHVLREVSASHDVDYELLKALIATESGFDASAISPKGAVGLMQLMPATAGRYGVAADKRNTVEQKLADPRTNIRAGASYLSYLIKLFPGELELALAAYNAGEGAVQRAGNRIPNFKETKNYVKTVMQLYTLLKPPATVVHQQAVARVHMTMSPGGDGNLPASLRGAVGRGNMIPSSFPATEAPAVAVPRDIFY